MKSMLPYVKSLLVAVERYHARPIRTTIDFEALSITIEQQTLERISASTLKRMWGYVSDRHEPRRYTLDVLAKYIGFRDFDQFCAAIDQDDTIESKFLFTDTISSTELVKGDMVEIGWTPQRYLKLEYLGKNRYRVCESQNSKLLNGDEFMVVSFMFNYPLYLPSIERNGEILSSFVAGRRGGLTLLARV